MIKILAFCPIKQDGTSFYRGFGPLNHLVKHFDVQVTDGGLPGFEISWDVVTQYDLLFFQRPSTLVEIQAMEIAKSCNRPIWIDYDDDYLNIPVTNPRYELYADPHRVAQILRAVNHADFITTSTLSIKEQIALNTGKDRDRIQVIPNAVDEVVFDTSLIQDLGDRKTVLWRGGDTHEHDLAPYLDKLIDLYNEFPDYTWAFMGKAPEALLKRIDSSRILLYPFEDVMTYFDRLFELRPAVTLVPWEENTFNAGKSNCSWLESTQAGAAVVFPKWSTEFVDGMMGYNDPETFYKSAFHLLSNEKGREALYMKSNQVLNARFTLGALATTRINIIHKLMEERINMGKLGVNHPKYSVPPAQYTDKEFFDYTWEKMYNQNSKPYADGHAAIADWLYEKFNPKSIVELGCGPGAMVERFCDLRVPQVAGFEINPHFQKYFNDRNPHYKQNFYLGSFLEAELDGVFDLCVSIEVFEHIPHDQLEPFIAKMADHFKAFYFSSTPYRSSKTFDKEWGHINIKTHEEWVKLFEANGFQYVENPRRATAWDALFMSRRINENRALELQEEHLNQ